MPLLAFHPQKEDPEARWAEGIGGVIEGLLSGEFKPFGWDLDREGLDPEFLRILEESYSEGLESVVLLDAGDDFARAYPVGEQPHQDAGDKGNGHEEAIVIENARGA